VYFYLSGGKTPEKIWSQMDTRGGKKEQNKTNSNNNSKSSDSSKRSSNTSATSPEFSFDL